MKANPARIKIDYSLYLVTDRSLSQGRSTTEIVTAAIRGGVTCVQLREKHCSTREFIDEARSLQLLLQHHRIPLIINDRLDVALAIGADGVHLGQNDMSLADARRLAGEKMIIGISAENIDDAIIAEQEGADYIGISPVFTTDTKADIAAPLGLEGIRLIRRAVKIPLVGIGGINVGNIRDIVRAGADGAAVVSAIVAAACPETAAAQLKQLLLQEPDGLKSVEIPPLTFINRKSMKTVINKKYHRVLTIAGSDSGGGAGIQADLKTIGANGCYGMSVITALTAQNTVGVSGIHSVPAQFVQQQMEAVLGDIGTDAVKIGMLFSPVLIKTVAAQLKKFDVTNIVLDPVMIAQSGDKLLQDEAVDALKIHLIPMASLITPNVPEASVLLGREITSMDMVCEAAKELCSLGCANVLIKGGHLDGEDSDDCLYLGEREEMIFLFAKRIATNNNHSTSCTLSSAIASNLAKGDSIITAVRKAKQYITGAIAAGAGYTIGKGHGPVHHFYQFEQIKQ